MLKSSGPVVRSNGHAEASELIQESIPIEKCRIASFAMFDVGADRLTVGGPCPPTARTY